MKNVTSHGGMVFTHKTYGLFFTGGRCSGGFLKLFFQNLYVCFYHFMAVFQSGQLVKMEDQNQDFIELADLQTAETEEVPCMSDEKFLH